MRWEREGEGERRRRRKEKKRGGGGVGGGESKLKVAKWRYWVSRGVETWLKKKEKKGLPLFSRRLYVMLIEINIYGRRKIFFKSLKTRDDRVRPDASEARQPLPTVNRQPGLLA